MEHYFTNNSNLKSNSRQYKCNINDQWYFFETDNGVFSKQGLDFGTRTLLTNLPRITGKVLDLGCGYGPIGIYLAKNNAIVDMIDINERSIKLAKKNSLLNNVEVNAFVSNGFTEVTQKYNYIISNPPIRVGKEALYSLLSESKNHLEKNGELWIVVNKNQGAQTLQKWLQTEYNVEIINKYKGFWIIKAKMR